MQHVDFSVHLPLIHLDFIRDAFHIPPFHVSHPFLHLFHDFFTGFRLSHGASHLCFE